MIILIKFSLLFSVLGVNHIYRFERSVIRSIPADAIEEKIVEVIKLLIENDRVTEIIDALLGIFTPNYLRNAIDSFPEEIATMLGEQSPRLLGKLVEVIVDTFNTDDRLHNFIKLEMSKFSANEIKESQQLDAILNVLISKVTTYLDKVMKDHFHPVIERLIISLIEDLKNHPERALEFMTEFKQIMIDHIKSNKNYANELINFLCIILPPETLVKYGSEVLKSAVAKEKRSAEHPLVELLETNLPSKKFGVYVAKLVKEIFAEYWMMILSITCLMGALVILMVVSTVYIALSAKRFISAKSVDEIESKICG